MASPLPPISYEEINLDYIRHLIGANAKVIVEVGAHHGWHTQAFLKTFSKARIYAFDRILAPSKYFPRVSAVRTFIYSKWQLVL